MYQKSDESIEIRKIFDSFYGNIIKNEKTIETYRSIWKIVCKIFEGFNNLFSSLSSLKVFGAGAVSLLDTVYPEAEGRSGTDGLPPDHVPRLRDAFTPVLFF